MDNYEGLVVKKVRAESKTGLQPSFYIQKTDQQVFRESWLAHNTAQKV